MPRRSDEHLEQRRTQILDAALRCFARNGFHATTMAEVVQESGMSAGAVYRYFPSKTGLVREGASLVLAGVRGQLERMADSPVPVPPDEAVRRVLDATLSWALTDGIDRTRIGVSAWAEALRDEDLHEIIAAIYTEVRQGLTEVARRWRDAGHMSAATDPEQVGQVLFACLPGFILQRLLIGDAEVGGFTAGLKALLPAR